MKGVVREGEAKMHKSGWKVAATVVALLAVGCPDDANRVSDDPPSDDVPTQPDGGTDGDVEGGVSDVGIKADGQTPGPTADPDATLTDQAGPMCGEFGDPCTKNGDCCSEYCVETFDGFQCTTTCIDNCPDGFECKAVLNTFPDIALICVPNVSKLCRECELDLQCNGGQCIEMGGGTFCTVDCSKEACPDGFDCVEAENGAQRCLPVNGTCDCSAATDGQVRPCGNQTEFGACTGVETCNAETGWGECDAPIPTAEVCDGVDNDCDGLADEDFKEAQPCEVENDNGACVGISSCQGSNGWVCSADTPAPEVCDFLDNDCDGTVDETFKTANGKYGTPEHCGGCGKSCEGLFPNGTATCDDTKLVPGCVVDTCDDGFYKSNEYQCLPELDALCQPCSADFQCGGGFCVTVGDGSYCSKPCGLGESCGIGYLCLAVESPDGAPKGQGCVPTSGTCGCTPATDGQKKPCTSTNEIGECLGFLTCDGAVGWGPCDATPPGPELCDGLDNDCNGLVDDGLPESKPCEVTWEGIGTCQGQATCFGDSGWVCNAPTPAVDICDYKDNDCDADVDEDFKDEAGLYAGDQNCGACGTNCDNAIPNAKSVCDASSGNALCVVSECAEGFYNVNPYLCLKAGESACKACTADAQCDGKECVTVKDGTFCADACTVDADCEAGSACATTGDPDTGVDGKFCVPLNGTCDCNADTAGAKKPCQVANDVGTCVGFETCDPAVGWSACTAVEATVEVCDGIDNDCNSLIDDGLPEKQSCHNEGPAGICYGDETCQGPLGWVCGAETPAAESCDFVDNDCDGEVDEDFKTADGKYGTAEHCGSCNTQCGAAISGSAVEACDDSKPTPQCIVEECQEGLYKLNDFQCVDQPDTVCLPCAEDADCFGGACTELLDGKKACLSVCDGPDQCANGFTCDGQHCVPLSGSCDCTEATSGVKKFCSVENEAGTCVGFSTCDPALGWSECDAVTPAVETCDGIDNDCNGIPDDGLPASKPCENTNGFGTCMGDSVCQGPLGWVCQAKVPAEDACDFLDNDCDGEADEDYKDDKGKYSSVFHCGTCGSECGGTVANSNAEVCDTTKVVPQCVATGCQPGFFLKNELECIPNPAISCAPCVSDDTCLGGKCQTVGTGKFCLEECAAGCKPGYSCFNGLCSPINGTCDCNESTAGQKRTCTNESDLGTCLGFETCDPDVGWTGCTAETPDDEVCDGKDNDCNGLIDDGLDETQVCFNKNVFGVCAGLAQCFGSAKWVCLAPEPAPEPCYFKDNDCDGDTDEDYKDNSGKYTTAAHCGTCNNACGDQYQNSKSEVCDASGTVPQCVVNECEDGFLKLNDFQCLEIPDVVCSPCASDANCFGAKCAQVDQGQFCLTACEGDVCPEGTFCSEGLCRPNNGTCDCNADTEGAKRTCSLTNELGTCFGFETCTVETGWGGCDASPPQAEICDGKDNDCNGFLDDALPAEQDCQLTNGFGTCTGKASCFGTVGWFCKATVPAEESCDFVDNDCDGTTDEDFKDGAGKYSSNEHCGQCNNACEGAILNATSICDGAKDVPQCVVSDCGTGWQKFNEFLCVPITAALCEDCDIDENCIADGAKCVQVGDGQKCGIACDVDDDCPDAYKCIDPGIGALQCVPATGSCDCDGSNLELQKACKQELVPEGGGPTQTCFGTNFCTATGWTGCTLPTELCNSLDDDCDGLTDEIYKDGDGKYALDEHCGKCNRNCAELDFANAAGKCDTELALPDCTFVCLPNFFDTNKNPADGCECEYVSQTDYPDGTDWNCDGIDGEVDNGVFVAKTGDDGNPGTRIQPMLTIQAAIAKAKADGKRDVYVNTSVYSENIVLQPGISVYGGYSADFGQRDIVLYETAIIGQPPAGNKIGAVNAVGISGGGESTVIDGFTIFGHSAQTAGATGYTVYLRNCDQRLKLRNNRILSGNGAPGGIGTKGQDGNTGAAGNNGVNAKDIGTCGQGQFLQSGGSAGTNACGGTVVNGGKGGDGYCPNYSTGAQNSNEAGKPGSNGGGAGGGHGYDGIMAPFFGAGGCSVGLGCGTCIIPPNQLPMAGSDGKDGSVGSAGASGSGCSQATGSFVNGLWQAGAGSLGGGGGHGGGGGGGGAGNGVQTCLCGSYGGSDQGGLGGGGGAGGCASSGGQGGTGGGGSFGVFVYYDAPPLNAPIIENNQIQRGLGGAGGSGGNAGVAGLGAIGGKGGASGTGSSSTFCAGKGGNGGKGGDGGQGGGGGGGCGGASYAIYAVGQGGASLAAIKSANTVLAGGAAGQGGQGGLSLTNSGQQGAAGAFSVTNF